MYYLNSAVLFFFLPFSVGTQLSLSHPQNNSLSAPGLACSTPKFSTADVGGMRGNFPSTQEMPTACGCQPVKTEKGTAKALLSSLVLSFPWGLQIVSFAVCISAVCWHTCCISPLLFRAVVCGLQFLCFQSSVGMELHYSSLCKVRSSTPAKCKLVADKSCVCFQLCCKQGKMMEKKEVFSAKSIFHYCTKECRPAAWPVPSRFLCAALTKYPILCSEDHICFVHSFKQWQTAIIQDPQTFPATFLVLVGLSDALKTLMRSLSLLQCAVCSHPKLILPGMGQDRFTKG